jgi:hypothetical protein
MFSLISNLLTSWQESTTMLLPVGCSTQIILKSLKVSFIQLKREPKQFIGLVVFFVLLRYIDLNRYLRRFVQKKALSVKITFCCPLTCLYFFTLHFCSSVCLWPNISDWAVCPISWNAVHESFTKVLHKGYFSTESS